MKAKILPLLAAWRGSALAAPLALAAALCCSGCGEKQAAKPTARDDTVPVTPAEVQLSSMDRTLPVTGTLAAKSETLVGAQVEGQVERTLVDFGARVKAGQELARIDTASYEALANQAAANLARARASALNAEQNLKRTQELQLSRISSSSELDAAIAQSAQAAAEVKAAQAAEAIAQLNLRRSVVKAPFEGNVSERIATTGDYVKIGASLYRIVDDSELKFIVQAPERYAAEVKVGQLVVFDVDAYPGKRFEGVVYLISPAVSVDTRGFKVGALVQNRDGTLKANTFARGEIVLATDVPTPTVPLEAVVSFAGVTKVFVLEDGIAKARNVTLGRIRDGRQEVLEGLKPGERVAVTGQTKLYEGAKVRLLAQEGKAQASS